MALMKLAWIGFLRRWPARVSRLRSVFSGGRSLPTQMVLEAAVNGNADAIITHNVKDFVLAVRRFGMRVLRPGELLQEMRS